ncbi:MAG: DUF1820 family protein [Hahellaceae bacterium]|nr:DUF1820 family protein [Hahellaceae bacterium]
MSAKKLFKVIFYNQEEIFEIYAQDVFTSELFGFIEVEQLLFGERSQLLVDPGEEKLKAEFSGVTRTYIPMNAIIRIDEVEQQGKPKVSAVSGSVTSLPRPTGRK